MRWGSPQQDPNLLLCLLVPSHPTQAGRLSSNWKDPNYVNCVSASAIEAPSPQLCPEVFQYTRILSLMFSSNRR